MSYGQAVRLYSALELCVFAALIAVALSDGSENAKLVLGWTHGVGWILLCVLVAIGCRRRLFPWWVFGATASPLGPLGSTIALELHARGGGPARAEG